MKNQDLPFQIGEHYENWEFDLDVLGFERMKGYDSYTYLREIIFFNKNAEYVELIFLFDILQFVLLIFTFKSMEELLQFKIKITNRYTDLQCQKSNLVLKIYYGNIPEKAYF